MALATMTNLCAAINNPIANTDTVDNIIKDYFQCGLEYSEILHLLLVYYRISISLRQLHRILRRNSLYRRKVKTPINTILTYLVSAVRGSQSSFGYRSMQQAMRRNGLVVDRETLRLAMSVIDADGVEARSRRVLTRRQYQNLGPNYAWHMDGYDKLKPFGFAIHAAIDGFSRKILWLRVCYTNNDPKIIGFYFLNFIKRINACPRLIQGDRGSENVIVAGIQRFLRRSHRDDMAAHSSFRYCKSTANQRIESWWSQFRKKRSNWWMNFFKDMVDNNLLDTSLDFHLQCVRFAFMGVIQKELDDVKDMWNNHRIRRVRNSVCQPGKPDILYFAPELSGNVDYSFPVENVDLDTSDGVIHEPDTFGCSKEFLELAGIIMNEKNLPIPTSVAYAKDLYLGLISEIDSLF